MTDPRTLALKSRAALWAGPSRKRAATLLRKKNNIMFLSSKELHVDRVALTQFAVILSLLMALYLVVGPPTDQHEWGLMNRVGPVSICLAGLWTGYKIVIANPRTIWTPMLWFVLTSPIWYGFGPLLYPFGPEAAITSVDAAWPVGPRELWRTNLLNTVSVLTVTAAFLVVDERLGSGRNSNRIAPEVARGDGRARQALFFYLGLGLPIRYLVVWPVWLGLSNFVVPGSVSFFCYFLKLAVFMLAYLGAKRRGLWKAGFWLLFVPEVFMSFLTLQKYEVFLVFIMTALGRFQATKNVKGLVLSGIVTLGLFVPLARLVTWNRLRVGREAGSLCVAPLDLRLAVAAEAFETWWLRGELEIENDTEDHGWARFCYANTQTAGMDLYDAGFAGDSFAYALYGWIPRFIWPDKPIMTLGEDFTLMIVGMTGISSGPGAFGEAYWNGGWLLVVLACGYIGALFAWLSRVALRIIANSEWLLLPCALLGITMGAYSVDWFAPTYIIGSLFYLVYYFGIRLVVSVGQNREAVQFGDFVPRVVSD